MCESAPVPMVVGGVGAGAGAKIAAARSANGGGVPRVTVYCGTSITSEVQIHAETGLLMSDAARVGYVESGGSIAAARAASEAAHAAGIEAWGSEATYAQAHSAFGTEISQVGPRSMISVIRRRSSSSMRKDVCGTRRARLLGCGPPRYPNSANPSGRRGI